MQIDEFAANEKKPAMTTAELNELLTLCTIAKIVAMNDDSTRDEKAALAKLAGEVKAVAIREINSLKTS